MGWCEDERDAMNGQTKFRIVTLGLVLLAAGCKSSQEKANEAALNQARQQAALTGTAQQVVYTDKDGSTVTTVVQPPAPGQATERITTTKTTTAQSTAAAPSAQPAAPVVSPVGAAGPPNAYPAAMGSAGPAPVSGPVVTPVAPADIEVPRGTTLAIRIDRHISVKQSRAGDRFTGEVVRDVVPDGTTLVAIPHGTPVEGVIDVAHRRGHFKGRSLLELRLTSMQLGGQKYQLDTRDNVRTKKGKGKRTAAFIGGGTGLGMLVGGVASGGVGLVVGGLVGGGAGTALGALTGNRDIEIPAESVINFKLADDLAVSPPQ